MLEKYNDLSLEGYNLKNKKLFASIQIPKDYNELFKLQ